MLGPDERNEPCRQVGSPKMNAFREKPDTSSVTGGGILGTVMLEIRVRLECARLFHTLKQNYL